MTTALKKISLGSTNINYSSDYGLVFFNASLIQYTHDVYIRWSRKKYPLLVDIFVHNLGICGHRYSGYML